MISKLSAEKNYSRNHQEVRQNWRISDWARKHGLSLSKIQYHSNIANVALLLEFDEHSSWFSPKDTEIWTHCWQWCYTHEHELSKYHRRKLLSIIDSIEFRQQRLQHIQARQQKKLATV
jgi:hypothetical protein